MPVSYQDQFKQALTTVAQANQRWGYTPEPGTELSSLRPLLARELSRQWGAELAASLLFIGPHYLVLLDGILRLSVGDGNSVLVLGSKQNAELKVIQQVRSLVVEHLAVDSDLWQRHLSENPPNLLVVSPFHELALDLPKIQWLLGFIDQNGISLIIIEPNPADHPDKIQPLMTALSQYPQVLEHVTILQPLEQSFHVPHFPLGVALIANPLLFSALQQMADETYSRTSTLIQQVYQKFLQDQPHEGEDVSPKISIFPCSEPLTDLFLKPVGHPDPIDMSFGESEWIPPVAWSDVFTGAVEKNGAEDLATRQCVVGYLRESRGAHFQPEQVLLGVGVQALIIASLRAIRQLKGVSELEVIVPKPSYGLFYDTVTAAGAHLVEVMTTPEQRFLLQAEQIQPLGGETLLLNIPTNPAGQYYSAQQLAALGKLLETSGGYLLMDEVFGTLSLDDKPAVSLAALPLAQDKASHVIIFGGISKEFAVGGLRLGFVASHNAQLLRLIEKNLLMSPDPWALRAARHLFGHWGELIQGHRAYLKPRAAQLSHLFLKWQLPFPEVEGGYALFVNLSSLYGKRMKGDLIDRDNLHDVLLTHAGIKIKSDRWARVPGYYRFVFAIDRLAEAVGRLDQFFAAIQT